MPITPTPKLGASAKAPDVWQNASFQDVTLVYMVSAIISSGQYAPGPLIMELALGAMEQIMVETGRWDGVPLTIMTQTKASETFKNISPKKRA
jgi:hypothetical protein